MSPLLSNYSQSLHANWDIDTKTENCFPRRIVKRLKWVPTRLVEELIDCRLWGWYKIFGSLPRQLSGLLLLPPLPSGDTHPQLPSPGPGLLWIITLWQDFSPLVRMKLVHVSLMVGGGRAVCGLPSIQMLSSSCLHRGLEDWPRPDGEFDLEIHCYQVTPAPQSHTSPQYLDI